MRGRATVLLLGFALTTWLAGAAGARAQDVAGAPAAAAVRVDAPQPHAPVTAGAPLRVRGAARGSWYFEASFPLRLLAADGTVLAEGVATAQGDWMTPGFVPFEAELGVPAAATGALRLVLERANPSGLPENAAALEVPLRAVGAK